VLERYKEELSRPFDEAASFLSSVRTQLSSLCGAAASLSGNYLPPLTCVHLSGRLLHPQVCDDNLAMPTPLRAWACTRASVHYCCSCVKQRKLACACANIGAGRPGRGWLLLALMNACACSCVVKSCPCKWGAGVSDGGVR
jgi:hypothetical protein